jgi:HK97 family phage major capsid protein
MTLVDNRLGSLREERAKVWNEAEAILTDAADREMTPEENAAFEARKAEVQRLGREIDNREDAEKVRAALSQPQSEPKLTVAPPATEERGKSSYEKSFAKFIRGGTRNLDNRELAALQAGHVDLSGEARALGTATGGAGGYTIPTEFQRRIVETMKTFGGMRQVANVISTDTGAALPWPSNNDTANLGAILDENTAMSELDVAFTTNTLGAFMYVSGLVRVSYQLLQDTFFDLEGFLARKLGERIGRIQNRHFTIGVDTTQPQGIAVGGTSGVTAASATVVTLAELMALKQTVDPAYRDSGNAKWMMNDTTAGEFMGLLDTTGRPLWNPDITGGAQDRLLGYPVVINQDMPHTATGLKPIAFGDFRAGYVIRDVRGIQMTRLDERYAEYLQVGFFAYARADGGVDDASAFRLLTMA